MLLFCSTQFLCPYSHLWGRTSWLLRGNSMRYKEIFSTLSNFRSTCAHFQSAPFELAGAVIPVPSLWINLLFSCILQYAILKCFKMNKRRQGLDPSVLSLQCHRSLAASSSESIGVGVYKACSYIVTAEPGKYEQVTVAM